MKKLSIALIYGGRSEEHEVSLRSAASVFRHLSPEKYYVHLIGVSREGVWYLQNHSQAFEDTLPIDEEVSHIISVVPGKGFNTNRGPISIDLAFPMVHGRLGEDGTLQGLLEQVGLPYVGCPLGGSYNAMDKEMTKLLLSQHGIPISPFRTIHFSDWVEGDQKKTIFESLSKTLALPLFVKPSLGGSSVGVHRVEKEEEFYQGVTKAFRYDRKVLVESAIPGRELECSVIGNRNPQAFLPGELVSTHSFYDYDAKYNDPEGACFKIPAPLPGELSQQIQNLAIRTYRILGCRGMARVDFFLRQGDSKIFLNEVNTIPGFTSISMFPRMCTQQGLSYEGLLEKLIHWALEDFQDQRNHCLLSRAN